MIKYIHVSYISVENNKVLFLQIPRVLNLHYGIYHIIAWNNF